MKSIIFGALAALLVSTSAFAQAPAYEIMAPASPGGGWDQTARAMQNVLQETKLASNVQVVNVPGAGGTIGLAQFVSTKSGNPNALLVGGYVMVGAILTNKSPVTLDQVTPLARLTGEDEAIVVPASSPYQTIADLAKAMKENPAPWRSPAARPAAPTTSRPACSRRPSAPTRRRSTTSRFPAAARLWRPSSASRSRPASPLWRVREPGEGRTLRLLATTGGQRVPGSQAPTLKEAGIDMELQNWRMVAGAPGLSADEQAATIANMQKMVDSPEWKAVLERNNWQNTFLAGDAFKTELAKNIEDTKEVLTAIGLVQ